MSRIDRNRARKERRASRSGAGISQIGFGPLNNRYPPINPLSEEQVEEIHNASLCLLRDSGIEVMSASVRAQFSREGASVDDDTGIVKVDPEMIIELISRAPREIRLT
ncbi:trimethylamine methyltransferase family protein, partial [Gammaproteobacteria bacterium]|nr:trimethylamine methyltransferase family protein [Gammaproteobacteria bacterium]